nr:hypothetical protein [uncultured Draconibacterium sp.]
MKLLFPFKNIAVNTLWEFRESEFLNDFFVKFKQQHDDFYEDILKKQIRNYLDSLPDFENEILQIINTSNQQTINSYFHELKETVEWVCKVDSEEIEAHLKEENEKIYLKFVEKVNKKSEEYFEKEERKKYGHLEEYEAYDFHLMPIGARLRRPLPKIKKTNYNFYCIDEIPNLIDFQFIEKYVNLLEKLTEEFKKISDKYIAKFDAGEIVVNERKFFDKTIVYVEGQHDIDLIQRAAELLNKNDLLNQIELRQRGGYRNLDKIWKFYKEHSVEIIAQIKILLYDCDTNKQNEDFGYVYKRIIPTFEGHIISKGIENLFNNITTQKAIKHKNAFIDFCTKKGTKRGVEYYEETNEVNSDEKANFCKWICENGTEEDFSNFKVIFDMIEEIITNANKSYM